MCVSNCFIVILFFWTPLDFGRCFVTGSLIDSFSSSTRIIIEGAVAITLVSDAASKIVSHCIDLGAGARHFFPYFCWYDVLSIRIL